MSLLTENEWRTSYRHEDGDLIELFYNPALACAVQYDRMTGNRGKPGTFPLFPCPRFSRFSGWRPQTGTEVPIVTS